MSRCLQGLDVVIGADQAAQVQQAYAVDIKQVTALLDRMKPMSVAQAHTAVEMGDSFLNVVRVAKSAYGGSLTTEQEKRRSDFQKFDLLVDSAHVDPLPDATAAQIRDAVLKSANELNDIADTYKTVEEIPAKVADAAKRAGQSIADAAKKVAWYANITYWVLIGVGALAAIMISLGIAAGVKHRISRT